MQRLFLAFLLCLSVVACFMSSAATRVMMRSSSLSMTSMGRRPLMGGNWKLNPKTVAGATSLASDLAKLVAGVKDVDVCVFPAHPHLAPVQDKIQGTNIALGGQNCYFMSEGAYTGAVSTCMLKDLGVKYVLAGHSERRTLFYDNDGAINQKVKKILGEGLKPVLCIGESKEEYEAGLNHEVCAVQIMKDLVDVSPEEMLNIVIAYEPVWAIGTGLVCPAAVAQEVHAFIRSVLAKKYGQDLANKIIIQYGGSVKPDNVKEIMSMPDIDGCLVGGASLTADSFAKIVMYNQ